MTLFHDYRFPGMTFADIRAELTRLAATNLSAAVAKGDVTLAQATHREAMFRALLDDVKRFSTALAPCDEGKVPARLPAPSHLFSWRARRRFLLDELARRQRAYPGAIVKGNLTTADAGRQFDRLAALLKLFEDGYDFDQPREEYTTLFYEMLGEEEAGQRRNFRIHLDTMPIAASSIPTAPASGRPLADKGLSDDRSRNPAKTLL